MATLRTLVPLAVSAFALRFLSLKRSHTFARTHTCCCQCSLTLDSLLTLPNLNPLYLSIPLIARLQPDGSPGPRNSNSLVGHDDDSQSER